jgi:hypothetical protein
LVSLGSALAETAGTYLGWADFRLRRPLKSIFRDRLSGVSLPRNRWHLLGLHLFGQPAIYAIVPSPQRRGHFDLHQPSVSLYRGNGWHLFGHLLGQGARLELRSSRDMDEFQSVQRSCHWSPAGEAKNAAG